MLVGLEDGKLIVVGAGRPSEVRLRAGRASIGVGSDGPGPPLPNPTSSPPTSRRAAASSRGSCGGPPGASHRCPRGRRSTTQERRADSRPAPPRRLRPQQPPPVEAPPRSRRESGGGDHAAALGPAPGVGGTPPPPNSGIGGRFTPGSPAPRRQRGRQECGTGLRGRTALFAQCGEGAQAPKPRVPVEQGPGCGLNL